MFAGDPRDLVESRLYELKRYRTAGVGLVATLILPHVVVAFNEGSTALEYSSGILGPVIRI